MLTSELNSTLQEWKAKTATLEADITSLCDAQRAIAAAAATRDKLKSAELALEATRNDLDNVAIDNATDGVEIDPHVILTRVKSIGQALLLKKRAREDLEKACNAGKTIAALVAKFKVSRNRV
jgi:hypothetical protein